MTATPIHTYKTIDGTAPTASGVHQPRTLEHTVTTKDLDDDLFMMTEIGDGVFVQWSTCRRCSQRVGDCRCAEGPQEPNYMKPWRDRRFDRSLDERPDPSYDLIPSVVSWLEERGYTVTKSVAEQLAEAVPYDKNDTENWPTIEVSECPTCEGTGQYDPHPGAGGLANELCPDCDGSGVGPDLDDLDDDVSPLAIDGADGDTEITIPAQRPTFRGKPVEDTPLPGDEVKTAVDSGLDATLAKLRAARDDRDDVGF